MSTVRSSVSTAAVFDHTATEREREMTNPEEVGQAAVPQLFCFTYAGGNASFFDLIGREMEGVSLAALEYPGHGLRCREACCRSFSELADDQIERLRERYTGGDYALFGYSMGSITLVEVLKRILADGALPPPRAVFLAAQEPRTKIELKGFTEAERDEWVRERTIRFGGVPESLLENKSFWRLYLPLYRADYTILAKYRFEDIALRCEIPAVVFYSESDTPSGEIQMWRNHFVGPCEFYRFEGNHFFITQHHAEMAQIISRRLTDFCARE